MKSFLFLVLLLGGSLTAQSAEISGVVQGDKLTWQSAQTTASGLTPAVWDLPISLPSAEKITPGGPSSAFERQLMLRGAGTTVYVPLTIEGVSYRLTSNTSMSKNKDSASTTVSGNSAVVMGAGVGNSTVTLSTLSTPFSHYRPMIQSIDANKWLNAFKSSGAGKGVYQGVINYSIPYDYNRDNVLVRYIVPATLVVSLDYNPAELNSVNVIGSDIIQPQYYGYPERLVSGSTQYMIDASGLFPNGVIMSLIGLQSDNYKLWSTSTSPQIGIDYSVECTHGCKGATRIITDGAPDINSLNNGLTIDSADNTSAQATIRVSFSDQKLSELEGDVYTGTFVLLFEAGI
ncbi:hypothetical protein [Vibrio sagamiensis]|uniref:Fimbrial protein n=1 Tax=Vibrio sagamiensis NBRC 104589 TaxID=1219064 RepID=A0A511QM97_9VIBR|nr:hypothetical protein [Vibrio sagamiensis]PNQ65370.1 hypothetical protein C1141_09285 [Vibrio agarivorans]GEM77632.1 hypothetical protein VSA01S_37440 [Vibrio sagamiensis NBRC 104589]